MPGITGIITSDSSLEPESLVEEMVASMQYEASYIAGQHSERSLGIHVGWVAHEHVARTTSTPIYVSGEITLILSGEIYNPKSGAVTSKADGNSANTSGATWFVHQYREHGEGVFPMLNGLFSALLIDKRSGKAFLLNDRYGSERLYVHRSKDAFYFASEAKALLSVLPNSRAFDESGVAQFMAYGCTFGRRTLFRDVELVSGATVVTIGSNGCSESRYFSPEQWESLPTLSEREFQKYFGDTFRRILPRYFQADWNIGIALTGGLDTRMILACQPSSGRLLTSYTFTGRRGMTRDDKVAAQVAKVCGLEHQLLRLHDDFFSDFSALAEKTVYITDGTFGVTGAHEIYFNRQARQLAPVRLTGLFGSEITRGISTFKPLGLNPSLITPELRGPVAEARVERATAGRHPISIAAFENVPWHLYGSVAANRSQVTLRTPYLDNELVSTAFQCPPHLRKSPATALQLIQENNPALAAVPTDRRVEDRHARGFRRARQLLTEVGFKLDYVRNYGTPHWLVPYDPLLEFANPYIKVFDHHKFLHYRRWFARELHGYVAESLSGSAVKQSFWNPKYLMAIRDDHRRARGNYLQEINAVLTLSAIERTMFHGTPSGVGGRRPFTTQAVSPLGVEPLKRNPNGNCGRHDGLASLLT